MHLLVKWRWDVSMWVWMALKGCVLGGDRQTQSLSLSLSLGLRLSLVLYRDWRHGGLERRGQNLKRLTRKAFRSF